MTNAMMIAVLMGSAVKTTLASVCISTKAILVPRINNATTQIKNFHVRLLPTQTSHISFSIKPTHSSLCLSYLIFDLNNIINLLCLNF
jgi:hypothetical protein